MDIKRLRELARTKSALNESENYNGGDLLDDLSQVLDNVYEHGLPDDVAEKAYALITACLDQVSTLLEGIDDDSFGDDLDDDVEPDYFDDLDAGDTENGSSF